MTKLWMFAAWLGATVLVSWVTFQALRAADGEVRDSPRTAVVVDSVEVVAIDDDTATPADGAGGTLTPDLSDDSLVGALSSPTSSPRSLTSPGQSSSPSDDEDRSASPTVTDATGSTTTTVPGATPTTTSVGDNSASSTSTSTTTTADEAWKTTTISSPGGSLTVSYRTDEVRYEVAVPAAGYDLEVESTGPDVKVRFTGDDDGWEIRARWNDGGFSPEVKET